MDMTHSFVSVRVQFEGLHRWPDAPEQVAFLKNPHRHIFIITAIKQVFHNDRDVEFFMLRSKIKIFITAEYGEGNPSKMLFDLGAKSCEMMAFEILKEFDLYECSVSEDGENTGIVRRPHVKSF